MRFLTALLVVALLYAIFALRIPSTHAQTCAPLIPPPLSGSPAPASPGLLFINEVLSKPKAPWYCPTTYSVTNAPWIELYNPQDQAFDLYTVHASIDTGPNTQPYYLPLGAAIAAHGYLVLFPAMYTNTLTAGTTLRLVISTVVIDQMIVPSLGLDQSYARVPDGATGPRRMGCFRHRLLHEAARRRARHRDPGRGRRLLAPGHSRLTGHRPPRAHASAELAAQRRSARSTAERRRARTLARDARSTPSPAQRAGLSPSLPLRLERPEPGSVVARALHRRPPGRRRGARR